MEGTYEYSYSKEIADSLSVNNRGRIQNTFENFEIILKKSEIEIVYNYRKDVSTKRKYNKIFLKYKNELIKGAQRYEFINRVLKAYGLREKSHATIRIYFYKIALKDRATRNKLLYEIVTENHAHKQKNEITKRQLFETPCSLKFFQIQKGDICEVTTFSENGTLEKIDEKREFLYMTDHNLFFKTPFGFVESYHRHNVLTVVEKED